MRMDEQDETQPDSLARFDEIRLKVEAGWKPTADEIYEFFKGVPLREVKHSAPTLRKMKAPEYLVEDRAVEMLRSTEECIALCELRLRILERLEKETAIEPLKRFGRELHESALSYSSLSRDLFEYVKNLGMDPKTFAPFFDRQFPILELGTVKPKTIVIREGRRPRRVMGVNEAAGSLVLSKKIDTRFKRLEFHLDRLKASSLRVNGERFEAGINGILIDLFVPFGNEREKPVLLDLEVLDQESRTIERVILDPNSMMTIDPKERKPNARETGKHKSEFGYYSLDERSEFAVWGS